MYKTKFNPDGIIEKHKARLVTKCFRQTKGIDFEDDNPKSLFNKLKKALESRDTGIPPM